MTSKQRYISKELTHFIGRDKSCNDILYQRLSKILNNKCLTTAKGMYAQIKVDTSKKLSNGDMIVADMICFCDIPFEDMYIHVSKYGPFGLSFTKDFIVQQGGYPVLYMAQNAKSQVRIYGKKNISEVADYVAKSLISNQNKKFIEMAERFDGITNVPDKEQKQIQIDSVISSFLTNHVLGYIKCFDHSLPEDHPDNYYFEREWRVLGGIKFTMKDIQRILIPKDYAEKFRKDFSEYCGQLSFTTYPDENNPHRKGGG